VQTTVYRLEATKVIRRVKKIGNAHIFEALVSRRAAERRLVDELLSVFGGRSRPVVAHLIDVPFFGALSPGPGGATPPPISDRPSIFSAVEEQLGLRLEAPACRVTLPTKIPVDTTKTLVSSWRRGGILHPQAEGPAGSPVAGRWRCWWPTTSSERHRTDEGRVRARADQGPACGV
jgi:hypothetical protein